MPTEEQPDIRPLEELPLYERDDQAAALTYRCATCGKPVTVAHAAAWPRQCPHCKTAPPTLILKTPS